jgi:competence protein ComEC
MGAAIGLAVGVAAAGALGDHASGPIWLAVAAAAAGAAVVATRRRGRRAAVAAAALAWLALVAVGWWRGQPREPAVPADVTVGDRVEDRIEGVVGGPVVPGAGIVGAPVDTGDAVVFVWSAEPLVPGQRVAATGLVHAARGYLDPGSPDRSRMLAARGADWEMTARSVDVLADDPGAIDLAWRGAAALQHRCSRAIAGDGSGEPDAGRAALAGIAIGDRGDVPPALDARWRALGIYHVLSVSGLHLAVVAGLAFMLLRRLIAGSPLGGRVRPARWAAPIALAIAIAYTAVTGAQLATLRALAVVALVFAGAALDRPLRLADALGAAAAGILLWRPGDLYDPSFQLSFVAAMTLARLPRGARPADDAGRLARIAAHAVRGARASLWVTITTAPITAYHFHQVAPFGVIGNLILAPVVELVALPLALAGVAIGELSRTIGDPLVDLAALLVGWIDRAAGALAHVAPVGTIAVGSAATMAALVALALWLAGRAAPGRSARAAAAAAALWLAMCALWLTARSPAPAGALRVTFLDVGQGDAAIVELPDGATWLVDAGGVPGARDLAAASAPGRAVDGALAVYGRTRVDLAIVSHPHPDHYLGFAGMVTPIDELWTAAEPEARDTAGTAAQPSLTAVAAHLGVRVVHPPLGVARSEAGVELDVYAPRYDAATATATGGDATADPVRTVNDNSLVLAIRYAGRTIVFAGDVEAEGEADAIAAGLPRADVVKVPHHGSPTSSTEAFVDATHPALAVISCGAANRFGFPAPAVVARWLAAGADVARTDRDGAVTVTIDDAGGLEVARFR